MLVNSKSKRLIRIQNIVFVILLCTVMGLFAWLSNRYVYVMDWTYNKSNTAAASTQALLKNIKGKIVFTTFISDANRELKTEIERLIGLYKIHKPDIELRFIDPLKEPAMAREAGVSADGELHIEYEDRNERVQAISEQAITNALQRLARSGERWLVFVEGHGERNPLGSANYDYTNLKKQLDSKGLKVKSLNLATSGDIPDNTSILILADPQKDYLPGEVSAIGRYLDKGGNLLWLAEPGSIRKLDPIAEQLGVDFLDGTVVDLNTQILGINDPRFALVAEYPPHPITIGFDVLTVFPAARGIEFTGAEDWDSEVFLETLPRSWLETDELAGELVMDAGRDTPGPIVLGLSLTRVNHNNPRDDDPALDSADENKADALAPEDTITSVQDSSEPVDQQQRVVIVGDADFLSDAYLGQGGNMELGLNIINWLTRDETLINIPPHVAPDTEFELSSTSQIIIGFGFLFVIPLSLLGGGIAIWLKRRKA